MKGGERNGRATDEHRLEHGEGRRLSRASDRHHDLLEQGGALLGRELVGDRPPRRVRGGAELVALAQIVDLDHDAVDLVGEVVPVLEPVLAEGEHVVEGAQRPDLGVDREAGPGQPFEHLGVPREGRPALDRAHRVGPERQVAARGDLGVLLAQRPRSRVAGVGEQAAACLRLARVELLERLDRHVDLAPHLEHVGRAATAKALGHHLDGAHVLGHVLADGAVASRRGLDVPALLVHEGEGDTVDLQLADIVHVTRDVTLHASAPGDERR